MKQFDKAYFEGEKLILYKSTGEGSGFYIEISNGSMALWSIPLYGGEECLEQQRDYICPLEFYNIAIGWT